MLRGEKANANGALVCVTLAEWMPTIKQVCAVTEGELSKTEPNFALQTFIWCIVGTERYSKAQYKEKQRSKVTSKQHLNLIICTAALSLWQHGEIKAMRLLKHASLMWCVHFSQAHYRF